MKAVSFEEMCRCEGVYVQRGMYFRVRSDHSLMLFSKKTGADYDDRIGPDGSLLIYDGHNATRSGKVPFPQLVDQQERTKSGRLTQNGRFFSAAVCYREGKAPPEPVQVYRKLQSGVWLDLGRFSLVDAWRESDGRRTIFKFKLRQYGRVGKATGMAPNPRNIPAAVRAEVWNRDGGKCVICGSRENLHFDHIIPVSRGGSGTSVKNVQLLCSRHNLEKSDHL